MQNTFLAKISPCLFLVLAMACSTLRAQGPGPAPAAAPSATPFQITPEQQEKLKVAYQKALQDPAVLAAQEALKSQGAVIRGIVKKKAIAADPAMQPIFDKADKAVADQTPGGVLAVLSSDEAKKLHDAFEKLGTDPEVKEAYAKAGEAKKGVNTAVRAAILHVDPSLTPVLDAIDEAAKNAPHPGAGSPPVH
jgi:hypothetical protein